MPTLDQLREQINRLDAAVIKNIARRQKAVLEIGRLKAKSGDRITDPGREAWLLNYHAELSRLHDADQELIARIFAAVIRHSRRLQKKL